MTRVDFETEIRGETVGDNVALDDCVGSSRREWEMFSVCDTVGLCGLEVGVGLTDGCVTD